MALIRDRKRVPDSWLLLERGPDGVVPDIPASGDVLVPLALWRTHRSHLSARAGGRLGVWLTGDEDPVDIEHDLDLFDLIAVCFSSFTDGRGYSIARLLRERYGWKGELRAIGDIQRDQMHYLMRCGFDAFELRVGEDVEAALAAYDDFTEAYQASPDRALPLFRRRAVARVRQ
jgi:uncharacterized protein (DUF934 family)